MLSSFRKKFDYLPPPLLASDIFPTGVALVLKSLPRTVCPCTALNWSLKSSFVSDQEGITAGYHSCFCCAISEERSPLNGGADAHALAVLFDIKSGAAPCCLSIELGAKYGLSVDNQQQVVSVDDRVLGGQVWYNVERSRKPQTFVQAEPQQDPTNGGQKCDFCHWKSLTAEDTFGRIERQHAVTASNLFKYCQPCHGLVMFKHHQPLAFSLPQLADVLLCARSWFWAAFSAHPSAAHPFFLWNCGPHAGASQFHGHAQVALSEVPFPGCERLSAAAAAYASAQPSRSYYDDLIAAHRAAGLALESPHGRAWALASLVPTKDMEVVVVGESLECTDFQLLLFVGMRALIDKLGAASFNMGIFNISLNGSGAEPDEAAPLLARVVSRGKLSSRASDFGGLEVFGQASIGNTDPYIVFTALEATLSLHT